jgi:hypothetical protein
MASAVNYCDLSGFKFLTNDQKLKYKQSWTVFNQVQSFNSNISTLRFTGYISSFQLSTFQLSTIVVGSAQFQQGNTNLTYFQFINAENKTRFLQGRLLHIQSYPNSNWDVVEQN